MKMTYRGFFQSLQILNFNFKKDSVEIRSPKSTITDTVARKHITRNRSTKTLAILPPENKTANPSRYSFIFICKTYVKLLEKDLDLASSNEKSDYEPIDLHYLIAHLSTFISTAEDYRSKNIFDYIKLLLNTIFAKYLLRQVLVLQSKVMTFPYQFCTSAIKGDKFSKKTFLFNIHPDKNKLKQNTSGKLFNNFNPLFDSWKKKKSIRDNAKKLSKPNKIDQSIISVITCTMSVLSGLILGRLVPANPNFVRLIRNLSVMIPIVFFHFMGLSSSAQFTKNAITKGKTFKQRLLNKYSPVFLMYISLVAYHFKQGGLVHGLGGWFFGAAAKST